MMPSNFGTCEEGGWMIMSMKTNMVIPLLKKYDADYDEDYANNGNTDDDDDDEDKLL